MQLSFFYARTFPAILHFLQLTMYCGFVLMNSSLALFSLCVGGYILSHNEH